MNHVCSLPQYLGLHLAVCTCSIPLPPEHFAPPSFVGGGLLQSLFLVLRHPELQLVNGDQLLHIPSTINVIDQRVDYFVHKAAVLILLHYIEMYQIVYLFDIGLL